MARKKETKRNDGYYEVKCIVGHAFDGKAIYKSFYSKKSKADARQKAEDYKIKIAEASDKSMKRFDDVVRELSEIKKEQVRASTYYNVKCMENRFIEFFGTMYIEAITIDDLNKYFRSRKDHKKSSLSIELIKLREVFRYAEEQGYIQKNICQNYKLQYGNKSESKKVWTPEQAELCLEYCKQHEYGLMVHIMLSYGLNRSETLGITIDSIDFENCTIHIKQSVTLAPGNSTSIEDTKNKYRNRIIAVSDETIEMIRASGVTAGFLFQGKKKDSPLSPNALTNRISNFMADMTAYYKEQGIDIPPLNPHELRHTRASIWVNEGRNLFAIAEQMGWSDLDMLRKRYAHGDINQLRKELGI